MEIREADVLEMPKNIEFTYIPKSVDFTYIKANETVEKALPVATYISTKKRIFLKIHNLFKRILDIIGGIVGIVVLIPLTMFIYIANIITKNKGPVFYTQERIGKNGKTFKMYKYRSMCMNADEKLTEYLKENEEAKKEYAIYKKLQDDPRVTKVGKFLRKTSLDEFPQFINVLLGNMSLVGPRPYLPRELEEIGDYYNCIINYKPGITGLWQVSGRSNVTFDERLDLDIIYHKKYSVLQDIKILFNTLKNVVKKEGAL